MKEALGSNMEHGAEIQLRMTLVLVDLVCDFCCGWKDKMPTAGIFQQSGTSA